MNLTVQNSRLSLLEEAIERYGTSLLNYLTSLTKDRHEAEELLGDLWVYVMRKFADDDLNNFGLLRFKAKQLFIDWYRKQRRNPSLLCENFPEHPSPAFQWDASNEKEEEAFRERFFAEHPIDLPNHYKTALWLYARYGYTFIEIGKQLNKPPSTIGDWIAKTREAIAQSLNSY